MSEAGNSDEQRACEGQILTIEQVYELLRAEVEAGRGGNKLLVEGPLTLFEVSAFVAEPGRCWLKTSWCYTHGK